MGGDVYRVDMFPGQTAIAVHGIGDCLWRGNAAGLGITRLDRKTQFAAYLLHRVDGGVCAARLAVFVDDAQGFKGYDLVKKPDLALEAFGFDPGMQVVLSAVLGAVGYAGDRKSTRLNSSH